MKLAHLTLALAATAAIVVTAPASARHLKHPHAYAPAYNAQNRAPAYPGAYGRDPDGVYIENEEVGRDPDPNVRRQLQNDYGFMYGW